jgi:LPXTG-motif cell wall-anchored protein
VVVLIDGVVVASEAVTITAAGLPATGGSGIPFALVGGALVLVLAGAALQFARRRRVSA